MQQGQKPILIQLGPYAFDEVWERHNVEFINDNILSSTPVQTFTFNQTLSNGTENDLIIFLNVPAMVNTKNFFKKWTK